MDANCRQLVEMGYSIIWVSGPYCRVQINQSDVLLKWNDDHWVML